ncbi:MAG: hypothetical protein ACRDCE_20690 [Cetobacterium sp.]|uniref:hypothetical protein n=1 Tax=Cetobacterium sp. TaxID=2071632 RepID=UPI003EE5C191
MGNNKGGKTRSLPGELLAVSMDVHCVILQGKNHHRIAEVIDTLDDERRENYIKGVRSYLKQLKNYANKFKDEEFKSLISEFNRFIEKDIEDTLYYEELDDKNRIETKEFLVNSEDRMTERSNKFDKAIIALNKKDPAATGSLQINL